MIINRGDVLVRANDPDGTWGNVDVLDLDEESFRRWIAGLIIGHCQIVRLWHSDDNHISMPLLSTVKIKDEVKP